VDILIFIIHLSLELVHSALKVVILLLEHIEVKTLSCVAYISLIFLQLRWLLIKVHVSWTIVCKICLFKKLYFLTLFGQLRKEIIYGLFLLGSRLMVRLMLRVLLAHLQYALVLVKHLE